jgi:hypothetical protein
MLNLKVTSLIVYLVLAGAVGAGSTYLISMNSFASADATAVLNCKNPSRSAEPLRHVDPVNSGRNKEY